MLPIPIQVTDVSVYPYLAGVPIAVEAVMKGASGTYSIGTLTTNIFYNMNLSSGKVVTPLAVGATYYAVGKCSDGTPLTAHWMYCLKGGDNPTFGLTKSMLHPHVTAPALDTHLGPYILLEDLKDFTMIYNFPPPAIGTVEIPLGKTGKLIGTRIGTPHLMGFQIDKPTLPSSVVKGSGGLTIQATAVRTGDTISYGNMTCEDSGAPAIFLQTFM